MRKSLARLAHKQADLENDAQVDPKVKTSRSENKTSNIVTLDNGTMIESFKYLNYMQLAKSGLVSKRYSNLIRTHRHSLALLYVDYICMKDDGYATYINIFDKELSSKAYNKGVIRNRYSKQIPPNGQVAENQSEQYGHQVYEMKGDYKDSNKIAWAFVARAELNHENWPLFQHFVRLLSDPFIYIRRMELTTRIEVSFINLLAEAMNPDYNRIRCNVMLLFSKEISLEDNFLKFIGWIKNHVHCNKFRINHDDISNYHEELLDLFVTGARCTSNISIKNGVPSNVIVAVLQKFLGLKNLNEYQVIESIRGNVESQVVAEELQRNLVEFIAEEEQGAIQGSNKRQVMGFINNDIEKKLTLSVGNFHSGLGTFSIKITDL